jgi:hypothetical protein
MTRSVRSNTSGPGRIIPHLWPQGRSARFYNSDLSEAKYASPAEVQAAIVKLCQAFPLPDSVELDSENLKAYGSSENSYHPTSPHSVIVRPKSTEDVVRVVQISREFKLPIVPYSGATSLEGHFAGVISLAAYLQNHEPIVSAFQASIRKHLSGHVRHGSSP